MTKQDRLIAANTARLLGYHIARTDNGDNLVVVSPISVSGGQMAVCHWRRWGGWESTSIPNRLTIEDNDALGHFLVRLHMEQHYGIKTDHYWDNLQCKCTGGTVFYADSDCGVCLGSGIVQSYVRQRQALEENDTRRAMGYTGV